jgi:peptidoglycan hydrolase-like protein with peptidoglycan-binding domain
MRVDSSMRQRRALTGILMLLLTLATRECLAGGRIVGESPDGLPERLVLALDGIPYDVFVGLQKQGHFIGFHPAARMVSTFPSLSDVSFAAIGGTEPPLGYQQMRFDAERNRVVGNTLGSLSSQAHPDIGEDSRNYSSMHRIIGYLVPYHIALREMREIGREFLASRNETFVAFLETSDAILHVEGRPAAEKFLLQLDKFLRDLQARVRERTGRGLFIDIVSDHGSTMVKGKIVPVERVLRRCGFERRDRIVNPYDAAYSLAGIIGSLAITTTREHGEEAARCLAAAEGVDLVAIDRGDAVGILASDGEGEVRLAGSAPETYGYRALQGDPLGLMQGLTTAGERTFDESALFRQTLDAPRPDPLRRLWQAFHGDVKEPSTILVSFADGREAGNTQVRAFAGLRGRVGTHGSMTRLSTLGVIASNWRSIEDVDSRGANEALFGARTVAAMRLALNQQTARAGPSTISVPGAASGPSAIFEVKDIVAEAASTPLESRRSAGGRVLDPAPAGGGVDEARLGIQDFEHLQRVGLPVRGELECGPGFQPVRDKSCE